MTQERLARMYQKITAVIAEGVQGLMNEQLLTLAKSLGIDMAQLRGMAAGQTAFDPYRILGLEPSASEAEVKRRYRQLLRKLHPDTAGVAGTAFLLQMVLTAYEMIKQERGWP